jgi:hypothetical protein
MKEIKLYKSRWRAIKLILLCSIFVIGGIFMVRSTDAPEWAGWFNIFFFGLGYPVGIYHLFDRRPQIIINELGIYDRTAHQEFINWKIIHDAYLISIHGQKFISLVVDKDYEPKRVGKFAKKLAKIVGAQELNISLGQVKIDEKRLAEFIRTMISAKQTDTPSEKLSE